MGSPIFSRQSSESLNDFEAQEFPSYTLKWIDGQKRYECLIPDCAKNFKFESEVKRHSLKHTDTRVYTCPYEGCDKTFKRIDAAKNHYKTHIEVKEYSCSEPTCDFKCRNRASLYYHVLKHSEEKKFKCTISGCPKAFRSKRELKQHEGHIKCHMKYFKSNGEPVLKTSKSMQEQEQIEEMVIEKRRRFSSEEYSVITSDKLAPEEAFDNDKHIEDFHFPMDDNFMIDFESISKIEQRYCEVDTSAYSRSHSNSIDFNEFTNNDISCRQENVKYEGDSGLANTFDISSFLAPYEKMYINHDISDYIKY